MKILYIYLNDETTQHDVERLNRIVLVAAEELGITATTEYNPNAPDEEEAGDEQTR